MPDANDRPRHSVGVHLRAGGFGVRAVGCPACDAGWRPSGSRDANERWDKPLLLEVCAGEGGSTAGLLQAGFEVIANDNSAARLKRNPAKYKVLGDAFDVLAAVGPYVAATWAGWPCQGYSAGTRSMRAQGRSQHDRLIAAGRAAQAALGIPYVIENVEGARRELVEPVLLCGRTFSLTAIDEDGTLLHLDRHRLIESSVPLTVPPHPKHDRWLQVAGVYGGARKDKDEARNVRHGGYVPPDAGIQSDLLGGVGWMSTTGRYLCIPPVYAYYVGRQLLDAVRPANLISEV